MEERINTIIHGDCVAGMNALPAGSVDLAFADPPFNIGYDYDVYQDKLETEKYVAWSREWIAAVYRTLKPDGSFWLAIGDEYAAELKIASQQIGFHTRSWVVWYYTFGVNCKSKFTRSHAHLFYFVKDRERFTFRGDEPGNRIPSARELVYNDKRANPKGRLPDDTWIIRPADAVGELTAGEEDWLPGEIASPSDDDRTYTLRPQDIEECFQRTEDTWYIPRVAGTFKERAGFHGCQMPEQLLGRIIRTCSHENELVLDPFSGSATTLVVAKKLGRKYLGFDISQEYIRHGRDRLASVRVGDRLDGSAEPTKGGRKTVSGESGNRSKERASTTPDSGISREQSSESRYSEIQRDLTERGIIEAFRLTYDGFSVDRVVADPAINEEFANACRKLSLVGNPHLWNRFLFRLRKSGRLADYGATKRTLVSWQECDSYLFASEIAWRMMLDEQKADSLDDILCNPDLASEFDKIAGRFAGRKVSSLELRWGALKLRKQAKIARTRGSFLERPKRLERTKKTRIEKLDLDKVSDGRGIYLLCNAGSRNLYVGKAVNLRVRLRNQFFGQAKLREYRKLSDDLRITTIPTLDDNSGMLAWQSWYISKYEPELNLHSLHA